MFERFFNSDRHSRIFAKGDIKYVILDLIKDKPSYGYEIMHSLEEQFHGFYSPSAGSVYPTLQMLEDMGYVSPSERDGKKVYTITDEGKKFLTEHRESMHRVKSHMRNWREDSDREELRDTFYDLRKVVRLVSRKTRHLDTDKLKKIREIVDQAYRHIEQIIEKD
jgi:DNA-binding PadR family transcriptional regulator